MSELTVRVLGDDDRQAAAEVIAGAFLDDDVRAVTELIALIDEPGRTHGVFDGDRLIGTARLLSKRMVLPGTEPSPVAGVSYVAVAPGHRRRGALTTLMRTQLETLHEGGEPIAALWASEGTIYGRFGYGVATEYATVNVPAKVPFRAGVDLGRDRVTELPREAARPVLRELYDRALGARIGSLARDDRAWAYVLRDSGHRVGTAFRFAVHPDGYAIYRTSTERGPDGPRSFLHTIEVVAATPVAYAALHRYLLDVDLIVGVDLRGSTQEPLTHLLIDPRVARRTLTDGLWLRVVDVDRAMTARRYAAPADLVLGVTDAFCPWNNGNWRVHIDESGVAEVSTTDSAADVTLDVADLGAILLGGTQASTLAMAGRIRERGQGAVRALSTAMHAETVPVCIEVF